MRTIQTVALIIQPWNNQRCVFRRRVWLTGELRVTNLRTTSDTSQRSMKRYFRGSRFSISFIVLSVHQCITGKDYYTFELIFVTSFCGRRTGRKPVDLQSANTQRRDPRAKANLLRVICQ